MGNVHLQQNKEGRLDEALIKEIGARTEVPLVIHGGSGVPLPNANIWRAIVLLKFNIEQSFEWPLAA